MRAECYFCVIKTVQNLVDKFRPENGLAEDFIFSIHELLSENRDLINPKLATKVHRIAMEKLNNHDLYAYEKNAANEMLLSEYAHWRSFIDNSDSPFKTAAKLAVVGNIIDYGAHSLKGDTIKQINSLNANQLTIDMTEELETEIKKADSILYLGDNAGEIFFDRLLIETIKHPNVTFAVRGMPIINDVTFEDAAQVGIDTVCRVISNGYDAPSTLLESCSPEFIEAYTNSDLIISKGQGNFEGLMNEHHPHTFFMLIAKCNVMGELLGVQKNDMVITRLKN